MHNTKPTLTQTVCKKSKTSSRCLVALLFATERALNFIKVQ